MPGMGAEGRSVQGPPPGDVPPEMAQLLASL
jgi:hypothetical protein